MGLDITVYKIVPKNTKGRDNFEYFSLIDDDGNYKNNFPEWTKKFERTKTESWYDWEKYKEDTGIDVKGCRWLGESYGEDGCLMKLWDSKFGEYPDIENFKIGEDKDGPIFDWETYDRLKEEHTITVDLEKVPTYKKKIKILWREEVGYQRKGFNKQFYDDYEEGKIGYYVWNKSDLERYKEDYCIDEEIKEHFQKYVIDPFIDGQCCVTFSW